VEDARYWEPVFLPQHGLKASISSVHAADLVKGRNTISIENVHPNATLARKDCHLLTIWMRVDGPEIFAGVAVAVQPNGTDSSCHWEYAYDLQLMGDYRVNAKVLMWNGLATVDTGSQCKVYKGNVTQAITEEYPLHAGLWVSSCTIRYRAAARSARACRRIIATGPHRPSGLRIHRE
jgi:hypothetical protein